MRRRLETWSRCTLCRRRFHPWSTNPSQALCSRRCVGTLTARRTASARGDKLRITDPARSKRGSAHRPKYMGEPAHRYVAARDVLGRPLRTGETVHHKNRDRLDFSPENLVVYATHGEHMRAEHVRADCGLYGCPNPHYGRGYCRRHYELWRRHGRPFRAGADPDACTWGDRCPRPPGPTGLCDAHRREADALPF